MQHFNCLDKESIKSSTEEVLCCMRERGRVCVYMHATVVKDCMLMNIHKMTLL